MWNYLKGKPLEIIVAAWEAMEDIQDANPYSHVRWQGFVPMRYERNEEN